jgi:hypothetical protein
VREAELDVEGLEHLDRGRYDLPSDAITLDDDDIGWHARRWARPAKEGVGPRNGG